MDVTIHVGLAKAASTYLQEVFFPGVSDATFVHAPWAPTGPTNPIQQFVHALLSRNSACLDIPAARREIQEFLAGAGAERVIISSEALFGTPYENHSDFRNNTDVLAEVFPAAKIWFVVRRQDRWLESMYSQLLKMGLSTTPQRFTNFRSGEFGGYQRTIYVGPGVDVHDLDWSCYVDYYRRKFGRERVLVQPYEAFARDRVAFLGRFCAFAGVAPYVPEDREGVNVGLSPLSAFTARAVNALPMSVKLHLKRWVPSSLHPARLLNRSLDPLLRRRGLFPRHMADAALRLHSEHNHRLADMLDEDLGAYGYY